MDTAAYEELTGKHLQDKRDNWRSFCPVHEEKTPSFYIHKETYLCHCFGCGVKGTLDFVLAFAFDTPPRNIRQKLDLPLIKNIKELRAHEQTFSQAILAPYKRIEMHPYLRARGFKPATVLQHGTRWDPEGRVVFPLRSLGGPVEGAVGRAVKTTVQPKWYFYWNGRKGDILYQPLDTLQVNIIVEGVFDVMWLNQHGYQGAAAIIGSTATKRQIELIKDNTDEVTLFLDNDLAGRIGQEKLARALMSSVKVHIARYPEGKSDPQECTEDELHEAIDKRQTYVEYNVSNRPN